MRKFQFSVFTSLIIFCCSCTNQNAPDNNLINGKWQQIGISKTADSERQPLTNADITWDFNADGTGNYTQVSKAVGSSPTGETSAFEWKLSGDDIILMTKTGRELKYTIIKKTADEMVWKTYITGDFFIVEKQ